MPRRLLVLFGLGEVLSLFFLRLIENYAWFCLEFGVGLVLGLVIGDDFDVDLGTLFWIVVDVFIWPVVILFAAVDEWWRVKRWWFVWRYKVNAGEIEDWLVKYGNVRGVRVEVRGGWLSVHFCGNVSEDNLIKMISGRFGIPADRIGVFREYCN